MYKKRNNELEVISIFTGGYDKQFYLREISKLTKLPLKTTQNTLENLEKNKVVKSLVRGKNKYFMLNLDIIETKLYLNQAEFYKTSNFLGKYPQFKTFLKGINNGFTIIVFGSFAKFDAEMNSDVDLLIIGKEQKLPSHLLPNELHQVNMNEKFFLKSIKNQEALIKEVEENHIVLNGHSFYINSMWDYYGKKN